jgi:hypothetical protein
MPSWMEQVVQGKTGGKQAPATEILNYLNEELAAAGEKGDNERIKRLSKLLEEYHQKFGAPPGQEPSILGGAGL